MSIQMGPSLGNIETSRPIRPLGMPLSTEHLLERRQLFGTDGRKRVSKKEYRLEAARQVPDFAPFLEIWERNHRHGNPPSVDAFDGLKDTVGLAAMHLIDTTLSDPETFRFLSFDGTARLDGLDLSGTYLAEYPDQVVQESGLQDFAAAALGRRGSVMEISIDAHSNKRKFARLLLPICGEQKERRPSRLIAIVRLLEYERTGPEATMVDPGKPVSDSGSVFGDRDLDEGDEQKMIGRLLKTYFHAGKQELLADRDLLEILIGQTADDGASLELAGRLVAEFGSLAAAVAVDNERLLEVPGMTAQTVLRLKVAREMTARVVRMDMMDKPVLSGSRPVLDYCRARMAHETVEHVRLFFLDQKNRLISDELIHGGGVASAPVSPRNIIKRAISLDAQAIIMVHNHPSGDPKPSAADLAVTNDVKRAGEVVGIRLLDHLVIGRSGHISLLALGYLDDA